MIRKVYAPVALLFALVLSVQAANPCREDSKDTSVDYQCQSEDVDCKEKKNEITINLGVSGGIVAVQAEGGISFTVEIPDGCDGQPNVDSIACGRATGVQFTSFSGGVVKLRKQDCANFDEFECKEENYEINISLPIGIIQQLEQQFDINLPDTVSIKLPAKKCVRNEASKKSFTCPGTNGGQTWYEVEDESC
jgi:hypothetical protein